LTIERGAAFCGFICSEAEVSSGCELIVLEPAEPAMVQAEVETEPNAGAAIAERQQAIFNMRFIKLVVLRND